MVCLILCINMCVCFLIESSHNYNNNCILSLPFVLHFEPLLLYNLYLHSTYNYFSNIVRLIFMLLIDRDYNSCDWRTFMEFSDVCINWQMAKTNTALSVKTQKICCT